MATFKRWVRPEVYPLFASTGVAVGICVYQLVRNITGNPEVRVTKANRAAGVLENFEEGENYSKNSLFKKLGRGRSHEIMPGLNNFMSKPDL